LYQIDLIFSDRRPDELLQYIMLEGFAEMMSLPRTHNVPEVAE